MDTKNIDLTKQDFYLGLSLLPNTPGQNIRAARSKEGRRILKLLDWRYTGSDAIETEELGRPCFTNRHADFSIAHSGFLAAVSFCRDNDSLTGLSYRTGCDVEYLNPRPTSHIERIVRRLFAPEEQNYLNDAPTTWEYQRRFYCVWTLKECFLKMKGLPVFAMPEAPVFPFITQNSESGLRPYHRQNDSTLTFHVYEIGSEQTDRYLLSTVLESGDLEDAQPPKLRWFSPKRLPEIETIRLC